MTVINGDVTSNFWRLKMRAIFTAAAVDQICITSVLQWCTRCSHTWQPSCLICRKCLITAHITWHTWRPPSPILITITSSSVNAALFAPDIIVMQLMMLSKKWWTTAILSTQQLTTRKIYFSCIIVTLEYLHLDIVIVVKRFNLFTSKILRS